MSDTGETQITSGSIDRFPVSARLLVVSFVLLVAVIGVAIWGERQASPSMPRWLSAPSSAGLKPFGCCPLCKIQKLVSTATF